MKNFRKIISLAVGVFLTSFSLVIIILTIKDLLTTTLDDVTTFNARTFFDCMYYFLKDESLLEMGQNEPEILAKLQWINVNMMAYFSLHLIASLLFINGVLNGNYKNMRMMIFFMLLDIGLVPYLRTYLGDNLWLLMNSYLRNIEQFYYLQGEIFCFIIMSALTLIITDSYYVLKHSY